ELMHRTFRLHRRIESLSAIVHRLEFTTAKVQRELIKSRANEKYGEQVSQVLLAPDVTIVKLAALPPSRGAQGTLAISRSAGAAILHASGLAQSADSSVYRAWWETKKGVPAKAGEFRVGGDGSVFMRIDLPALEQPATSFLVTNEPAASGRFPAGKIALSGKIMLSGKTALSGKAALSGKIVR
ncbi:MAG TPA: anti-sigma factor, partial [Candidatus Binataceae bacterium]